MLLENQSRTLFCFFSPDDDEVHWDVSAAVLHILDLTSLPTTREAETTFKFDIRFFAFNKSFNSDGETPISSDVETPISLDVIVGSGHSSTFGIVFALTRFGSVAIFDVENAV